VAVHNVDGTAVRDAIVVLYGADRNDPGKTLTTDENGVAAWTGLAAGEHTIETYYNGEFWGSMPVAVGNDPASTWSFTRHEPYWEAPIEYWDRAAGERIVSRTVGPGRGVGMKMVVHNASAYSRSVKAEILVDRNGKPPYDYRAVTPATEIASGEIATFTFDWTPAVSGGYRRTSRVYTLVDGSYRLTDSWGWTTALDVVQKGLVIDLVPRETQPVPGEGTGIVVRATSDGRPVPDVAVILRASSGSFASTSSLLGWGTTGRDGRLEVTWDAPGGVAGRITADARKRQYGTASAEVALGVEEPAGEGANNLRPAGFYGEATERLDRNVAYLTFDDGPSAWTGSVLDTLRARGVRASFFIASHANDHVKLRDGEGLSAYRTELLRMIDEGHVIGNHATTHAVLSEMTPDQVLRELDANEAELNHVLFEAGRPPYPLAFLRPPFGAPFLGGGDFASVGTAFAQRGFTVLWNVDSGDSSSWVQGDWLQPLPPDDEPVFYDPNRSEFRARVREISDAVLSRADGQGMVVLLHDIHATTRDALPALIDGLSAKGYRFETVEHLARKIREEPDDR